MRRKIVTTEAYFRASEVCRRLGISATALRARVAAGSIPWEQRGSQRVYPAKQILALERATKSTGGGGIVDDQGRQDAKAIAMLQDGATDGEVIRSLRMSLERVTALRKATRTESPDVGPKIDPAKGYQERRQLLAKRRAERDGGT